MPVLTRFLTVLLLVGLVVPFQHSSAQTLTPRNAFIHMMNAWSTRIAMLRVCNKPRRAQSARTVGVRYLTHVLGMDQAAAEKRMDKGINHFVGFFRRALASNDPRRQQSARRMLTPEACDAVSTLTAFEIGFHRARLRRR